MTGRTAQGSWLLCLVALPLKYRSSSAEVVQGPVVGLVPNNPSPFLPFYQLTLKSSWSFGCLPTPDPWWMAWRHGLLLSLVGALHNCENDCDCADHALPYRHLFDFIHQFGAIRMRNESHTAAQEIPAGHDLPQGRAERSEEDLATTETFALGGAHGVSGIATETYRKKCLADYLGALGMASQCSKWVLNIVPPSSNV